VLPNNEIVSELLPEHFILFKPREIVSGDFYFIKQINNVTLVAAADCTGHGVPGAFMSMLGIALLNEIVQNSNIKRSDQVLNELRDKVKHSLQQKGHKDEQPEGMDMAFCAINSKTMEMSFAGANNPCWIFRKNKSNTKTRQFIVLDANRNPVGVHVNEKPFTEHTFQLQKGDTIYLFSDGYNSQFGGEKNEMFKTKRLKDLLSQIQDKDLESQRHILEQTLTEWQGKNDQIDDILIIGVRFN